MKHFKWFKIKSLSGIKKKVCYCLQENMNDYFKCISSVSRDSAGVLQSYSLYSLVFCGHTQGGVVFTLSVELDIISTTPEHMENIPPPSSVMNNSLEFKIINLCAFVLFLFAFILIYEPSCFV